jgi:hypothetical protein
LVRSSESVTMKVPAPWAKQWQSWIFILSSGFSVAQG